MDDRTSQRPPLSRRSFLSSCTVATVGSLGGCLGDDRPDEVVLDPPDDTDELRDADIARPTYGDRVPEVSLPAPLHDRTVSTTEFVGDRHAAYTFVFTRCTMACPALTATLVQIQADAADEGYGDEVALLPITFDPEHDTGPVLEEYGGERGVDRSAGNWWFLRPESEERAQAVVEDQFGVFFEYLSPEEREEEGLHEDMAYLHANVVLLVNADGYVERMYHGDPPNPATVVDDVRALRNRW